MRDTHKRSIAVTLFTVFAAICFMIAAAYTKS